MAILRSDPGGRIRAFFEQKPPRNPSQAPTQLRPFGWRLASVGGIFVGLSPLFALTLGADTGALVLGGLLAVAGLSLVRSSFTQRRRVDDLLVDATLIAGRVTFADEDLHVGGEGHGWRQSESMCTQDLRVVYTAPDGRPLQAALRFDKGLVAVEHATGANCYVLHSDTGPSGLWIPGYDVVRFDPAPATDPFPATKVDYDLEGRLRDMGRFYPAWWVAVLPLTLVLGVLFGLAQSLAGLVSLPTVIITSLWIAGVAALLRLRKRRKQVTVIGRDGVVHAGGFVPWARVVAVQRGGLRLDDYSEVLFYGLPHVLEDLGTRARVAWQAHNAEQRLRVPEALDMGERSPAQYTADARGLLDGRVGASARAVLNADKLWSIASNVRVSPEQRGAATLALSRDTKRDKLRFAALAEETAHPELKTIFEAAAEEDQARLEATLPKVRRIELPDPS